MQGIISLFGFGGASGSKASWPGQNDAQIVEEVKKKLAVAVPPLVPLSQQAGVDPRQPDCDMVPSCRDPKKPAVGCTADKFCPPGQVCDAQSGTCRPAYGLLQQNFLQAVVTPQSGYNIMAVHDVGTGKTCGGLGVAFNFIDAGREVWWVTRTNLQSGVADEARRNPRCFAALGTGVPQRIEEVMARKQLKVMSYMQFANRIWPNKRMLDVFRKPPYNGVIYERERFPTQTTLQERARRGFTETADVLRNVFIVIDEPQLLWEVVGGEGRPDLFEVVRCCVEYSYAQATAQATAGGVPVQMLLLSATPGGAELKNRRIAWAKAHAGTVRGQTPAPAPAVTDIPGPITRACLLTNLLIRDRARRIDTKPGAISKLLAEKAGSEALLKKMRGYISFFSGAENITQFARVTMREEDAPKFSDQPNEEDGFAQDGDSPYAALEAELAARVEREEREQAEEEDEEAELPEGAEYEEFIDRGLAGAAAREAARLAALPPAREPREKRAAATTAAARISGKAVGAGGEDAESDDDEAAAVGEYDGALQAACNVAGLKVPADKAAARRMAECYRDKGGFAAARKPYLDEEYLDYRQLMVGTPASRAAFVETCRVYAPKLTAAAEKIAAVQQRWAKVGGSKQFVFSNARTSTTISAMAALLACHGYSKVRVMSGAKPIGERVLDAVGVGKREPPPLRFVESYIDSNGVLVDSDITADSPPRERYIVLGKSPRLYLGGQKERDFVRANISRIISAINDRALNVRGEMVRYVLADRMYREGVSFFDVSAAHLLEPLPVSERTQAIGRVRRFCGQCRMPYTSSGVKGPLGWSLDVYVYDVVADRVPWFDVTERQVDSELAAGQKLPKKGPEVAEFKVSVAQMRSSSSAAADGGDDDGQIRYGLQIERLLSDPDLETFTSVIRDAAIDKGWYDFDVRRVLEAEEADRLAYAQREAEYAEAKKLAEEQMLESRKRWWDVSRTSPPVVLEMIQAATADSVGRCKNNRALGEADGVFFLFGFMCVQNLDGTQRWFPPAQYRISPTSGGLALAGNRLLKFSASSPGAYETVVADVSSGVSNVRCIAPPLGYLSSLSPLVSTAQGVSKEKSILDSFLERSRRVFKLAGFSHFTAVPGTDKFTAAFLVYYRKPKGPLGDTNPVYFTDDDTKRVKERLFVGIVEMGQSGQLTRLSDLMYIPVDSATTEISCMNVDGGLAIFAQTMSGIFLLANSAIPWAADSNNVGIIRTVVTEAPRDALRALPAAVLPVAPEAETQQQPLAEPLAEPEAAQLVQAQPLEEEPQEDAPQLISETEQKPLDMTKSKCSDFNTDLESRAACPAPPCEKKAVKFSKKLYEKNGQLDMLKKDSKAEALDGFQCAQKRGPEGLREMQEYFSGGAPSVVAAAAADVVVAQAAAAVAAAEEQEQTQAAEQAAVQEAAQAVVQATVASAAVENALEVIHGKDHYDVYNPKTGKRREISGNGNCLFLALATASDMSGGAARVKEKAKTLRTNVVKYLKSHREKVSPFWDGTAETYDAEVDKLMKNGVWNEQIGDFAVVAAAEVLKRPVVVRGTGEGFPVNDLKVFVPGQSVFTRVATPTASETEAAWLAAEISAVAEELQSAADVTAAAISADVAEAVAEGKMDVEQAEAVVEAATQGAADIVFNVLGAAVGVVGGAVGNVVAAVADAIQQKRAVAPKPLPKPPVLVRRIIPAPPTIDPERYYAIQDAAEERRRQSADAAAAVDFPAEAIVSSGEQQQQPPSDANLQAVASVIAAQQAAERLAAQEEARRLEEIAEQAQRDADAAAEAAEAERISEERAAQAARVALAAAEEAALAAEIVEVGGSMTVDEYEAQRAAKRADTQTDDFVSANSSFASFKTANEADAQTDEFVSAKSPASSSSASFKTAGGASDYTPVMARLESASPPAPQSARPIIPLSPQAPLVPKSARPVIPAPPQAPRVPQTAKPVVPVSPQAPPVPAESVRRVIPLPPPVLRVPVKQAPVEEEEEVVVSRKKKKVKACEPAPEKKKKDACGIPKDTRTQLKLLMKKIKEWEGAMKKVDALLKRIKGDRKPAATKRRKVLQREMKNGKKDLKKFKAQLNKIIKRFS